MKTILMTLAEDMIARNIFYTYFWDEFLKKVDPDTLIVLAVQANRAEYFRKTFQGDNVQIVSYTRSRPSRLEDIVMSIARSSINSHTNLWSKMRSYFRGDSSFFATYFKRFLTYVFGGSVTCKRLLRKVILYFPADKALKDIFDEWQPDILFCASVANYDFDVLFAREAKRRGIRIVGMVRSWDNLSSHGLLRIVPDVFVFQNRFLEKMARTYQAIREEDVESHVIGLPHYDFIRSPGQSFRIRDEFLKSKGIDPRKRVILYCAMGEFLFSHENELPTVFNSLIEEGAFGKDVHLLYRAHPRFMIKGDGIQKLPNVTFDVGGRYIDQDTPDFTKNENLDLVDSLRASEIVVTGASTVAIDAAILDKPIVCVGFDGLTKSVSYWESIRRFYDTYTHFEALVDTGGVKVAYDKEQLVKFVNQYFENPLLEQEGRKRIVEKFAAPFDGHAGQRLADILVSEFKRVTNATRD